MTGKILMLMIIVIYSLTPYSIKNINVRCQCGCQEFICYCCQNPENFGDVTSFSECKCDGVDELFGQFPAVTAYSTKTGSTLDQIDSVVSCNDGSTLPGFEEPPMRPPPGI